MHHSIPGINSSVEGRTVLICFCTWCRVCFYVSFFFLCHGQLVKAKAKGKKWRENAATASSQVDGQHVNQAHALAQRKKPEMGKIQRGDRGNAGSATKCLHLAARNSEVEGRVGHRGSRGYSGTLRPAFGCNCCTEL